LRRFGRFSFFSGFGEWRAGERGGPRGPLAAMNWRRGLFRLWIVGAALFVIAVVVISYRDIKEQFDAAQLETIRSQLDTSRPLPQWTDDELRAYIAMPRQITPTVAPWFLLGLWASIAFGIPLAVLILGASLVWAFSGFAATPKQ
jgi:hypothetical protein